MPFGTGVVRARRRERDVGDAPRQVVVAQQNEAVDDQRDDHGQPQHLVDDRQLEPSAAAALAAGQAAGSQRADEHCERWRTRARPCRPRGC